MRSASLAVVFAYALALAACGTDTDRSCTPDVTYRTVGQPFVENWCRGCHSSEVSPGMRQHAPDDLDFDTLDEIRARLLDIDATITMRTMPPAGGPSDDERALMTRWLQCGAAP